jgi:RNA polymerase sigma factor (sigma-70 family)
MPVAELPEDAQGGSETADAGMLDPSIWSAVAALPAKQRAAVVHRYVLDLPYGDIARVLNCSEEAARASASEGRRKLRALLTDRREEVTR